MGLIHSRAAKERNRAEAAVLREQARALRAQRVADTTAAIDAGGQQSALRQPTLGEALAVRRRNKQLRRQEGQQQ